MSIVSGNTIDTPSNTCYEFTLVMYCLPFLLTLAVYLLNWNVLARLPLQDCGLFTRSMRNSHFSVLTSLECFFWEVTISAMVLKVRKVQLRLGKCGVIFLVLAG